MNTALEFINKLKLKKAFPRGDELHCLCPFHDDKQTGNFSINLITGVYFCFSCLARGNIIRYAHNNGIGYEESVYLFDLVKKDVEEELAVFDDEIDGFIIDQYKSNGVSTHALERLDWDIELALEYEIHSDENNNPIFLTKDWEGRYKGVWVRDMESKPPYLLIDGLTNERFGNIWGMHLPPTELTVVCEGFFDAAHVRRLTGYKAVALTGTYATKQQMLNLCKMKPLYFMLDGDKAGRIGRDNLHRQFSEFSYDTFFCGGYLGDPDQASREQLLNIIGKAKSWLDYFFDKKEEVYDSIR